MKKLLIISLSLILAGQITAQRRERYEDELPKILALPSSGIPPMLKRWQAIDPENTSINFQLGVVYWSRFNESDILTEFEYKNGNARKALEHFRKARIQVTQRDVDKNPEYYVNFGTYDSRGRVVVTLDTLQNMMDMATPVLEEFIEKAPPIYDSFTRSFSHYDKAHKLFSGLVGRYRTFNDLILLYNDQLDQEFEQIRTEYDNALRYFSEYKSLTDSFPINYDQELEIEVIEVYRLDGFSAQINFLENRIRIWNYAKWIDDTRAYINANINSLRDDLIAEDRRVNGILAAAESDYIRESFEPLDISKELLFTLRKYDLQSVIEPILLYKEVKHDLMYQKLLSQTMDTSSTIEFDRKLYLYGQMLNKIANADTILSDVMIRNTLLTHAKYGSVLDQQYNGQPGIAEYVDSERSENQSDFSSYVSNIRSVLFDQFSADSAAITEARYRGGNIPMEISFPVDDESLTPEHLTTHKIVNFDGSAFVAGIKKNEAEGKTQAYFAGISPEGNVGWYKEYLLQIDSAGFDAHTRIAAIQVVPGGCAFILNGVNPDTGDRINHLMMLDEAGEEKLSQRLNIRDYPRTITYVERSNSLLVTFKGSDYVNDIFQNSGLIIVSYNILGDFGWQQRINFKGDIVNVDILSDGYLVTGNFNEITDFNGRVISAGGSNTDTNLYILKLTPDGDPDRLRTFGGTGPYFTNKTYKVSDNCINFFGSSGPYNPGLDVDTSPDAVHLIINKDLTLLSSTLN